MRLTTKELKQLIKEEMQEIVTEESMNIGYQELISAVQDVLYREPPQGEEAMDLDRGGMVKNPNKLAGAIAMKIFKMMNPKFEE